MSVKLVTPAPTVPTAVQVLPTSRSTRNPVSLATSCQARATEVSDAAVAVLKVGWPGNAGVTAEVVA